ncbi:SDR family NAD(P)-dependent oxidoreductase [Mycolicibacterium sp. HK-90]|uniref:SDR family NAD(P)-dependent oxidoreductase n=1 Tax=Mycolicibacterium sp. HK-90 TaxID=3056937 RepID=UPI002659B162|nr:SDR family oxidoreductase [Mycolicibacterium sp. HK-90]WKG03978.1 SDR family oxidoreductase [Mycolicibacterium sp. HK-90]
MGILDGKVALITGAGQGVGRGIAMAMAREGAGIAVVDRNGETAAETVTLIEDLGGGTALYRICDVRNSDEVNSCVASVVEALGTVDILVNNAVDATVGIALQDIDDEQFLISFASGPFASFWFMRACFPYLQDGGRVINLRSGTENQSLPGYGPYVAAKAAVGGLTRAAAREWGREGITVNALVPFALTPSAEADLAAQPGRLEAVYRQLSIPRSADVEADVGRAAVFLAGPDASFITGCTVSVDGGGSFFA